jgi:hypothetical protein
MRPIGFEDHSLDVQHIVEGVVEKRSRNELAQLGELIVACDTEFQCVCHPSCLTDGHRRWLWVFSDHSGRLAR